MDEQNTYAELTEEELNHVLAEKINGLSHEKRVYLLDWMKKEFPD